jgi:aminopeptidase-like protein
LLPNYHTRNDVCEQVHPQSLSVSLQMAIDLIERIDRDRNHKY